MREYGDFDENCKTRLPEISTDAEITVCRDIRALATVVIENSKELAKNKHHSSHVEVTFIFADLVMGPEFSREDKETKLFSK